MKRKLCPSNNDPPVAKLGSSGNLVSAPKALKQLYLDTYKNRLKHRDIKPELQEIFVLKTKLWESRLENIERIKSPNWTMSNLDTVLSSLKRNKSRDPNGMVNELFKEGLIGHDLKYALLLMFNRIKAHQEIPSFLLLSNITSIYKGKGSRLSLENDCFR